MDKEICWNLINSLLAGGLVFLGGLSTGKITIETFYFSFAAAGIVAVSQFKDYWVSEKPEYCPPNTTKLFNFISF